MICKLCGHLFDVGESQSNHFWEWHKDVLMETRFWSKLVDFIDNMCDDVRPTK